MSSSDPIRSATIDAADEFTVPEQYAGPFTLFLPANTGGANVCRLMCSADGVTYIPATNRLGVDYGFTLKGSYVIENVSTQMWYKAGSPAADYDSGSYAVHLVP